MLLALCLEWKGEGAAATQECFCLASRSTAASAGGEAALAGPWRLAQRAEAAKSSLSAGFAAASVETDKEKGI